MEDLARKSGSTDTRGQTARPNVDWTKLYLSLTTQGYLHVLYGIIVTQLRLYSNTLDHHFLLFGLPLLYEDESPDWHLRVVHLDDDNTENESDDSDKCVPPVRNFGIDCHEA